MKAGILPPIVRSKFVGEVMPIPVYHATSDEEPACSVDQLIEIPVKEFVWLPWGGGCCFAVCRGFLHMAWHPPEIEIDGEINKLLLTGPPGTLVKVWNQHGGRWVHYGPITLTTDASI